MNRIKSKRTIKRKLLLLFFYLLFFPETTQALEVSGVIYRYNDLKLSPTSVPGAPLPPSNIFNEPYSEVFKNATFSVEWNGMFSETTSNSAGYFTIDLPFPGPGTYELILSRDGYVSNSTMITCNEIGCPDQVPWDLTLIVLPPDPLPGGGDANAVEAIFLGYISNENGSFPISTASVFIAADQQNTDIAGIYKFVEKEYLPAIYDVFVGAEGYCSQIKSTILWPEGLPSPVDFNLDALSGDINADRQIDIMDSTIALQVLAGMDTDQIVRPDYAISGADINENAQIDIAEAIYTLQICADLRLQGDCLPIWWTLLP